MGQCKSKGDVSWYLPNRKTPIAYSTKAASDIIVVLAADGGTIQDVYDSIIYDREAREILKKYIDKGYGNVIAKEFFK